jgi:hypothetical protein
MPYVSEYPFTDRLVAAHPSLAHRKLGEVILTSAFTHLNRGRRMEMKKARVLQAPIDECFQGALSDLSDTRDVQVLQIGAHDGTSDDPLNSALSKKTWSATLVEPTDTAFKNLELLRGQRPDTSLINKAVTADGSPVTLYVPFTEGHEEFSSVWSSPDKEQVLYEVARNLGKHMVKRTKIRPTVFEAVSPSQLLEMGHISATSVNVLVCDIEGPDPSIIKGFLDAEARPEVLMFEHYHDVAGQTPALINRLYDEGYSTIIQSTKDTLALRY